MTLEPAPFFDDVAEGPPGGSAWWCQAGDGVRIRVAAWPLKAARGTVLLFPGRTEYAEKYGITAAEFAAEGYALLAVDWRGQGLADRAFSDRAVGHVGKFSEYQKDVAAVMAAAAELDLPRPWHVLGHSMGGCIALRALIEGLAVESAAFSAPMWGLEIAPVLRPIARPVSGAISFFGFGHRYAPGTGATTYVDLTSFEENRLTRDRPMFDYMRRQVAAHPELALGGPSVTWVHEALRETRALAAMPAPAYRAYAGLGTAERIVDPGRIRRRMADWPGGEIEIFDGAEHEILMEGPGVRGRFVAACVRLFDGSSATASAAAS